MIALVSCYGMAGSQLFAFALLGPYAPWMQRSIGFRLDSDIGGPMTPDDSYRWNVPVLNYGFDQQFIEYFGESRVAAVEEGIAILNDLPPASELDLDSFPFSTWV